MKYSGLLLLALVAALLLEAGPTPVSSGTNLPPCCRLVSSTNPPTDKSIYLLDSEWTSDVGRQVRLGVLRGRPQVLALFFASCEVSCPLIVNDMKNLQAALPPDLREGVDFVLVSIDPERDTPAALRAYRERVGLGTDHWTLLTGRGDDVRELAALLGVNYQRDSRGQFAHSNLITILDADGEIIHRQIGINQDPKDAVASLMSTLPGTKPKRAN